MRNLLSRAARRATTSARTSVLLGFADYLGFPRWASQTRFGRRLPEYRGTAQGVGATEYSRSSFAHYRPLARVRWPLFLLASIPGQTDGNLLVIGPRFESEFYLARGLGWSRKSVTGLDLLSYSPLVTVGDMHQMPYPDEEFRSIVCGWTISYSYQPEVAAKEMARVLQPGGVLVLGVEVVTDDSGRGLDVPKGASRIQNRWQFEALLPEFECVACFAPEGSGNLIIAMRKPPA
jgi:hypothetical protein